MVTCYDRRQTGLGHPVSASRAISPSEAQRNRTKDEKCRHGDYNLKGSTYYGIGNALAYIIHSILNDDHRIIAVSAILDGEYGQNDICTGVPAVLTRHGIKEIVELNLIPKEQEQFGHSCTVIRGAIASLPPL